MKVSLVDFTGNRYIDKRSSPGWKKMEEARQSDFAAALLIFTKSTRLEMKPGLLDEIVAWPHDKKMAELDYMANTIPSSWEFCHYTFMIEGVTRAFTHQLVRTRTASFAQQTMRVLNVDGWNYGTGPTMKNADDLVGAKMCNIYHDCMTEISDCYGQLIREGVSVEDARGILPTNIHTNIVMGANLRTMVEMIRKRSSPRTQGEYRDVLDALKAEMLRVHPWVSLFIERDRDMAAKELDEEILNLPDKDQQTRMIKLVDQLRSA